MSKKWKVKVDNHGTIKIWDVTNKRTIATIIRTSGGTRDEHLKNAELIADAPALLEEASKILVLYCTGVSIATDHDWSLVQKINKLLNQ